MSLRRRGATTGAEAAEDWLREEVTWSCWGKSDEPAVCGEKLHMRMERWNEWIGWDAMMGRSIVLCEVLWWARWVCL